MNSPKYFLSLQTISPVATSPLLSYSPSNPHLLTAINVTLLSQRRFHPFFSSPSLTSSPHCHLTLPLLSHQRCHPHILIVIDVLSSPPLMVPPMVSSPSLLFSPPLPSFHSSPPLSPPALIATSALASLDRPHCMLRRSSLTTIALTKVRC
ncbi:hypothetical protein Syun_029862 [Stephania yunnanensis]|uniref:Uncharacterized protein n=1 Tax=Stephania yunnanensis TaxID=152371 RepID=A0AAP0E9E5_9MAGN